MEDRYVTHCLGVLREDPYDKKALGQLARRYLRMGEPIVHTFGENHWIYNLPYQGGAIAVQLFIAKKRTRDLDLGEKNAPVIANTKLISAIFAFLKERDDELSVRCQHDLERLLREGIHAATSIACDKDQMRIEHMEHDKDRETATIALPEKETYTLRNESYSEDIAHCVEMLFDEAPATAYGRIAKKVHIRLPRQNNSIASYLLKDNELFIDLNTPLDSRMRSLRVIGKVLPGDHDIIRDE